LQHKKGQLHENIQELIDEEAIETRDDEYFKKYHSYAEIVAYLKKLHEDNKSITSIEKIADTWDHRDVLAVKLAIDSTPKPQFVFNAQQHAREWIASPVLQYILTKFIEKYKSGDTKIVNILKKYNIVFIPLVNPDGLEFSRSSDRLWRKNRRNNGGNVFGVDLNRNWQVQWGIGASKDPRSLVYQGPSPLSEPETKGMHDYLTATQNNTKAGIDFHSYSQLILRPYGYKHDPSPDEAKLKALGAKIAQSIKEKHGLTYQNIKGIELYIHGGTLMDEYYGIHKYPGFCIELRDTGRYGFILPPDQIIPTSEENLNAVTALIENI